MKTLSLLFYLLITQTKKFIPFILFSFITVTLHAQFSCDTGYYCSLDLTKAIFQDNQIDSLTNISYAKSPQNSSYRDVALAGDDPSSCTISDSCSQSSYRLIGNAYFPKDTSYKHYNDCALPVIVVFHPGGYSDCSSMDSAKGLKFMCVELAKRNFVVFDMEYRQGRLLYPSIVFDSIARTKTVYQQTAVYRALQDVKGALRSIMKAYDDSVFAGKFRIDTSKLFVGRESAGAGAVLFLTYCQKQDMADEVSPGIHQRLGSINAPFYYADTSYPLPTVKGVWSGWGGFAMPGTANTQTKVTNFFARNNYTAPFIAFQGLLDPIVPFDKRNEQFPPGVDKHDARGNYDTTSFCLDSLLTLYPASNHQDLLMIGALTLQQLVQNKGKAAEVNLDSTMHHGLDDDCPTCNFKSDFGTGLTTQRGVQLYMVQRIASMFQSIITHHTIPAPSLFKECENYRHSCNTLPDNHNCPNAP